MNTAHCFSSELTSVQLLPRLPYEVDFVNDLPSIGFAFESQHGTHAFASDRKRHFYARANSFAVLPADCAVYSQSQTGGEYLKISMQASAIGKTDHIAPARNLLYPALIRLAYQLRYQLLNDEPIERLQLEQYVLTIAEYIFSTSHVGDDSGAAQWMTEKRASVIEEYIESRLGGQLSVVELASLFDLSEGFFSREFKSTFGKSPYDYVIEQRLSRARTLLHQQQSSLTNIALDCGFSSHAHMSSVFRKRLGISPRTLQKKNH